MQITNCGLSKTTLKACLAKKIETTDDYMAILPTGYRDFSRCKSLKEIADGQEALVGGILSTVDYKSGKPSYIRAKISQSTGEPFTVVWFGQDYLYDKIRYMEKKEVVVGGKFTHHPMYGWQTSSPEFFYLKDEMPLGIYPSYRKIKGVSSEMQRGLYSSFNKYTAETIETPVLEEFGMRDLRVLYGAIHSPRSMQEAKSAMDEYHTRELASFSAKLKATYPVNGKGLVFRHTSVADAFVSLLPFPLTPDQEEATNIIKSRTLSGKRMNLLLQGDVGCGKTVLAFYSMFLAAENGTQATLAVPTSVLAEQHYLDLSKFTNMVNSKLGTDYKVVFLRNGMKASEEKEAAKALIEGTATFAVGTHSTFSKKFNYKNLGLIVVDEEHRFGVAQREALKEKAGTSVHTISMSATPIPRSLATVIHGENCEVFPVRSMPAGRMPVKTTICSKDATLFTGLENQLAQGRQAFVVCPLVEQSDNANEKVSVAEIFATYRGRFEPKGYSVDIAHGKMPKKDLETALEKFRSGETKILIATTVVEVGVNIPNANIIIIENADLFGLATLHQLRGRVGRGKYQSYCVLRSEKKDNERLQLLTSTTDGFEIAEKDLEMRGAGNLVGIEQTGYNRYLSLILLHPNLWEKAKEIAAFALNNKYFNLLSEIDRGSSYDGVAVET